MRIQNNIMAMNAYRNYSNNTSALSKNLEKLSSGYKINRAGDDAAGLAISEKMRAQITGLEGAQSNAKDGISLVQTAEGALTEVHDMLNRMYSLAEQSANGTYENETDRAQLQKEVTQLKDEINRIADSSNFNGIQLLDGSMTAAEGATSVTGLDGAAVTAAGGAAFTQDLTFTGTVTDGSTVSMEVKYLDKDGKAQTATVTFAGKATAADMASAAATALQSVFGDGYTVSASSGKVTIKANDVGVNETQVFGFTVKDSTGKTVATSVGAATAGKDNVYGLAFGSKNVTDKLTFSVDGQTYEVLTRGQKAQDGNKAIYLDKSTGALNDDDVASIAQQLKDYGVDATIDGTTKTTINIAASGSETKGGLTLQIGDTSDSFNQLNVSIKDCHTDSLGIADLDIGTQEGAKAALETIENAINYVSDVRGTLGATQNRLDHTINNLSVMQENIQDAESTIRDTDVAEEMMSYTKNNILIQSAQAMLAQANQVPQGVLQLLQ